MNGSSPWWRPETLARRASALRTRAALKQAARQHFFDCDFVEIDPPILQRSPGNETHISAFATQIVTAEQQTERLFLHTSPEFTCKKLLAAGVPRLFAMTPVFRNRERGRLHHPEFLMLEWYRAGATLDALIDDCGTLLRIAARAADTPRLRYRGAETDPFAPPLIMSVVDAFDRHAGLDLPAMLPDTPGGPARFAEAARALGQRVSPDDTWSDLFSKILSGWIEPNLGLGRPTVLTRYPASEAALACLCPDDPRFAERFELYCCGVELANAFHELTDGPEQRRRFEAAEAERLRIYGETYPIDEDFLAAVAAMPAASGAALGFDRLAMLATDAERIEDVLWAPVAQGTP